MDKLSELIEYLENKYSEPVSFMSYLANTYDEIKKLDNTPSTYEVNETDLYDVEEKKNFEVNQEETRVEAERNYLTFRCDENVNLEIIKKLLKSIKKYEKKFFDMQKNSAENKLLKKYIDGLKSLKDEKFLDKSEVLVAKYIKTLNNNLMKLWNNKDFSNIIRQYLSENDIHIEEYEIGHKLINDDFELLDGNIMGCMSVQTDNPMDKYKVIEMTKPIIKIYYEDEDDELNYEYIPGYCKYYK